MIDKTLKKVIAIVEPSKKHKDTFKNELLEFVGKEYTFQYIRKMEDNEMFPGEWLLIPLVNEDNFSISWIPEFDLKITKELSATIDDYYGYDINGQLITESSSSSCLYCGKKTFRMFSDGSEFYQSCGCNESDYDMNKQTDYIITNQIDNDCDIFYITGLENAMNKYEKLNKPITNMGVVTLATVVKTNM